MIPFLEAKNLGISFEGKWIFRGLSFQIMKGESAALIGPSGHGKSVLLKIISGLLPASEGSVRLGTEDVGMLFQRNALFDSFSVEENLLFPLRERKKIVGEKAKHAAHSLLDAVGLLHAKDLNPSEISGGMQKRLGIARALIVEPELALYDEPTAGLDPVTSRGVAELILNLKKERGMTLLSVTNDMQRARQLGNRIFYLTSGVLHEGGSAMERFMTGKKPA